MTRTLFAALTLLALAPPAGAQVTYTWAGSGEVGVSPRWLAPAHWTGGTAGQFPGVTASGLAGGGSATDIARFNSFPDGISQGIGIDFGAAGGQLTLGAIQLNDNLGGPAFGNMSDTTPGVLRLNGATVAGVPNVVIANTSYNYGYYGFAPMPNWGTGGPSYSIALGGADNVFLSYSSLLFVRVPVNEAVAGAGVTVMGQGATYFETANGYTGRTRVIGGLLGVANDASLGVAPAVPTPGHIVIQPDANGPGTFSTNYASFTLNANRGIAIGPTSGSGDGVLDVPGYDGYGGVATVTYNGVIANNGPAASGRLVKTGGGTLVLGGQSTFSGGVLHNGGELRLTSVNALPANTLITVNPLATTDSGFYVPTGVLAAAPGLFTGTVNVAAFGGASERPVFVGTADGVAGGETQLAVVIQSNRPITIRGGSAGGTRFSGGAITGSGHVTVTGTTPTRVVTFDGNFFPYTGGTTVASGTLLLINQGLGQSGTGTGAVSVTGGTLGGDGRAAGAVTVGAGGRITAGTSLSFRRLWLDDSLAINGGRYRVVLYGNGNQFASLLEVAGAATLTNSPEFELDLNGLTVDGMRAAGPRIYTVLFAQQSVTGTFAAPDFSAVGFDPSEWSVSYPADGKQVVLKFTPVPEPAGVLLVAGVVLGLCVRLGASPLPGFAGRGRRRFVAG